MANTPENTDKKTTARKTTSTTSARAKSARAQQQPREQSPGPMQVLRGACAQLAELTGMEAESVSSFERTEDGWSLTVEVLELARVPDTMSLLASYDLTLDANGELSGYRRVRRYERGRADRS
ncbi:gas vesicle protein [Streptomyces sp. WAC05374]|uniref:gas vesicle protein GvpO n=1 Tax=Streptomyces sp. WAC05374 TaxID=2487420 RepID=UPI000F86AF63|nr:gas vesicle protein [Streptomyces sp. WAC05374]RST15839.1 gas vesicle protein [Streptomyces sp. WAC05374]TDF46075.1 gas vesicle protein [Streptomyces sp. WAC05374]TDF53066.1 gas vesicle protein [Streptomyces sp. WAC05374]TDF58282.1 gas vesicle protein [Streptomyces sp. WAC05374]